MINKRPGGERPAWIAVVPKGRPLRLDYKLKHVCAQLLGLRMPHFPGAITLAPYSIHATYLASDLLGTKALYDFLWSQLPRPVLEYHRLLVAPLLPVLLDMAETGVAADMNFLKEECGRLDALLERLSTGHAERHGIALGMDERTLCDWLFNKLRLPVLKRRRQGRAWVPSLDKEALSRLCRYTEDPAASDSLRCLQEYRQVAGLVSRLRSLARYVEQATGRIYSTYDDKQASGRVSSSYPNLQQLARGREVAGEKINCRNALRASDGCELVAFDIAQADIRVLAAAVENFPRTTAEHLTALRQERLDLLAAPLAPYWGALQQCRNPDFVGTEVVPPVFNPQSPCQLAAAFRSPGDFYTNAVTGMIGKPPANKAERDRYKPIILAIVNGKGPPSLARDLHCSEAEARGYLTAFERAYPKVLAYKALIYQQIALTGRTETFAGRVRTVTAHRWLVTEPSVEILVSYRGGEAFWVEVVPLLPSLRVLTTYVRRAWHGRTGRLLYDHQPRTP